ncbi:NUDIX hydrolase [Pelagicoccus sp. SDUM812003]|uniref:NUDIX hydrolase n=1 Tax=Pelagicoccus sp. SDUM812003 TaxID=3041267 RepID=UPI00280CA53C|nr:NUDIX hydrolase [Pelagicoccus sp. SDUM812003]MDQ8201788.1 NUDIX hydrolase [Pelagicoccus sp. SDUM812003]
MKREPLIRLLEEYRSRWSEESATCERFLEFVRRREDCFERSCLEGHVTGSAWLVNGAGTHVLLTHHRKLGQWFQLGGHADGEADVTQVALSEAREESGLPDLQLENGRVFDLDIHLIPERKGVPSHYHYDLRFVVRSTGSEAFQVSAESLELAWVEVEGISAYTREESMLRMARKWLQAR